MVRHRMVAPINSIKHYVQQTLLGITGNTVQTLSISDSVVAPAAANTFDVVQGAVIKAIYVEMWVIGTGTPTDSHSFSVTVEKLPADLTSMTFAQSTTFAAYPNKKNILYTTQGALSSRASGPAIPIIRNWIKIPRGKQRQGLGDRLVINLSNITAIQYQICGVFVYKEYR